MVDIFHAVIDISHFLKPYAKDDCMKLALLLLAAVSLPFATTGSVLAEEPKVSEKILGVWQATSIMKAGKEAPPEAVKLMRMTFKKDEVLVRGNFQDEREVSCNYKLDAMKSPMHFDLMPPGEDNAVLGILRFKDGKLEICFRNANNSGERPEAFEADQDKSVVLMKFERVPAKP